MMGIKINDLPVTNTASSSDKFVLETSQGTKAITKSDLLYDIDKLYRVEYEVTKYAEINKSLSDNKIPYILYDNNIYFYTTKESNNNIVFNYASSTTIYYIFVRPADTWGRSNRTLQTISEKVQTITSASTTAQYPSAKAVYDFVKGVMDGTITL